jgi:hypothetical protein
MGVFISHSFEDRGQFDNIVDQLEEEGIPYWNPISMRGGTSLSEQLREAIAASEVCIFVATHRSVDSAWCGAELGAFWGAGKPVIIYLADSSLSEDKLPRQFQGHFLERRIRHVINAAKEYLDTTEVREEQSPEVILSSLILFSIYNQLEKGRIQEVLEWLDEFKGEVFLSNTELALVQAILARLCGKGKAFSNLRDFPTELSSFYEIAQYELALLRFSKPSDTRGITPPFQINNLPSGIRKLWGSLLALSYVHDQDWGNAHLFFDMIEPTLLEEDVYAAYASAQIGVVSAALGLSQITEKYFFDIAKKINKGRRYPIHGYPYASLIAKHNRAFVLTVLGVADSELRKQDIQLLRGHSHVIARCSYILRLCDPALETIMRISETWPQTRLDKESVKQRLAELENHILSNAGTLFLGA